MMTAPSSRMKLPPEPDWLYSALASVPVALTVPEMLVVLEAPILRMPSE